MILAAGALLLAATGAAPPPPPSVLLVTLDTTRADRIVADVAPNLAALPGVHFSRAWTPVPLTLPAHATMLTGLPPEGHAIRDNAGFRLRPDVPTLAETMRRSGRRTGAFVSSIVLDRAEGLDRGFDVYDDDVRSGPRSAFDRKERAASTVTDAALRWLATGSRPFFLWVHYYDPHRPWVAPEPWAAKFRGRPYDAEIAYADSEFGRLLAAARGSARGRLLVVVAGDHGEGLGEHGEEGHGIFLYEETQHVPLIVSGFDPGIPADRPVGIANVASMIPKALGLPPLGVEAAGPARMETWFPAFAYGWAPLRAIVEGSLKYVDAPRPELYDLAADPGEKRNLVASRPDDAARLRAKLGPLDLPDADPAEGRSRLASLGYVGGSVPGKDAIDPKDGVAWLPDLETARRELQAGAPDRAVAPLERLLSRNPENVPALLLLGEARARTGSPDRAEAAYRRAIERNPENALAWLHLASVAPLDEAVGAYEKALALSPRDPDAFASYLATLRTSKRLDAAEKVAARARAARIADPEVEVQIALVALASGDEDRARAALLRASELDPTDAAIREAIARLDAARARRSKMPPEEGRRP